MQSSLAACLLSSLLVLSMARAKPVSSLQSLNQLLEEERNAPYLTSEEAASLDAGKDAAAEEADWDAHKSTQVEKDSALARLLNDILLASPKRSWRRVKKGGLRSCFGVRLERIGSFSGLGC